MKCNKCGAINDLSARFCRHCGEKISTGKNIMDRYLKLNFIPTNLIDWKRPWVGMFIRCMLRFALVMVLVQIIYCVFSLFCWDLSDDYDYYGRYDVYSDLLHIDLYYMTTDITLSGYLSCVSILISWLLSFLLGICIINKIVCNYPKRPKDAQPLHEVADYCQKYSYWGIFRRKKTPKFVFFVKDNKFGILDVAHYSVFLPARYDFLEWREKKKYLNAIIDGRN